MGNQNLNIPKERNYQEIIFFFFLCVELAFIYRLTPQGAITTVTII